MRLTMILLTVLAVSGCVRAGDFCVVYDSAIGPLERATVVQLVKTDREAAEKIDARDTYFEDNC